VQLKLPITMAIIIKPAYLIIGPDIKLSLEIIFNFY